MRERERDEETEIKISLFPPNALVITYGTWVRVLVKEERFVGVGAGAHLRILFCQSHISQINDLFDHFCIGDMSAISFQRKPLGEAILTRIKTPPTPFARRPSL